MAGSATTVPDALPVFLLDPGLNLIEGEATLTFVFFLGISLLGTLGLRFSYYAERNMRRTQIDPQRDIWGSLRYIGVLGAAYSGLWLLEIVASLAVGVKNGLWLAMTVALALSLREISTTADPLDESVAPLDRLVRFFFLGVVVAYVVLAVVFGPGRVTALVEGAGGVALLAYGTYYFRRQIASTRLQGTMLDSLTRHLMPVLTFAALFSIVALASAFGADRAVVLHVQLVFLIMTATAMMTATIKLRQNLASL